MNRWIEKVLQPALVVHHICTDGYILFSSLSAASGGRNLNFIAEDKISPNVELISACHSDQREESYFNAEDKISPNVEMTNVCHSDQGEESHFNVEDKISPIVEMTNVCHSDQREESYFNAEDKVSPIVEMTSTCHSDQRDDCKGAEGRAMHGAAKRCAEEPCIMTLGDNYLDKRRNKGWSR